MRKGSNTIVRNRIQNLLKRSRFVWRLYQKLLYFGTRRYCPVCNSHLRVFHHHGLIPRPNARCPVCKSLERHRQVWLYVRQSNLFDQRPKTMLHVAPEFMFALRFRKIPHLRYITTDLLRRDVRERCDLTAIPHPDQTFDIVHCSHVLEHIPDDRAAMRELWRVLKVGGWAMIDVPITADVSFEDLSVTDPKERERLFGQHDHVRRYGLDIIDRLQDAGFQVQTIYPPDLVKEQDMKRLGLLNRPFFVCTRS
jgi:SAM-dependent methyltransferase